MQLQPNTTLQNGKYRILKVLGQGGFGITYLAEHTLLEDLFAIKEFFPKTYCDRDNNTNNITIGTRTNMELVDKLRRRFIKEAKNLRHLRHDGIVQIHDIFPENNSAYFVMEYIEGESLSSLIKREGKLSEERAVNYIKQIGEALSHIHKNKVTHFDIKPANIMIRKKDDKAVLIDFGLSVQYTEEGDETSTNIGAASPGYSAIEMYDTRNLQTFSPSTDVYSLAATLYFLLTAKAPLSATKLLSEDLDMPDFISDNLRSAIEAALQPRKHRTKSVEAFISQIDRHQAIEVEDKSDQVKDSLINTEKTKATKKTEINRENERTIFVNTTSEETVSSNKDVYVASGIKFVDLGLSVLWADRNVDANDPNDVGRYFTNEDKVKFTDTVNSDKIKIPSEHEINELILKCKWRWYNISDKNGIQIMGLNGNSIFLPCTGLSLHARSHLYGIYWTNEAFYNNEKWFLYISRFEYNLTKYIINVSSPIRLIRDF